VDLTYKSVGDMKWLLLGITQMSISLCPFAWSGMAMVITKTAFLVDHVHVTFWISGLQWQLGVSTEEFGWHQSSRVTNVTSVTQRTLAGMCLIVTLFNNNCIPWFIRIK
jgi:hypothetical protein